MIREEIFKGILNKCERLDICPRRETNCRLCPIRETLIDAENALCNVDDIKTEAYNKGLNDAWEFVRKTNTSVYPQKAVELLDFFGVNNYRDIFIEYTPQEALAKLEAYEKEQNEIKVGDVVERINFTELFVVSGFNEEIYTLINANGKCVCANVNQIKKTGKHIDIQSLLEQIKE